MNIEIWSDVMCPFCYIGKRRFEEALSEFTHKNDVTVEWKSFQLNPHLKTDPSISIHDYLAEAKGWQPEYARQLNDQVTDMAAQVGLEYNMDNAVVANSFNAHHLLQLAKQHNLGDEAEEALFKAYFTLGRNIDDLETLVELAESIGLNPEEAKEILSGDTLKDAVYADLREAQELGINAVPFFVINRKYAVAGAQPAAVFLEALNQVQQDVPVETGDAYSCDVEKGNC